jgi:hypothetical protein
MYIMHSILDAGAHHTCIFICTMFLSEAKSVPIPTYGTAIIWEKLTAKQPDHNRWSEGKISENDTQYVKTPPSSLKVRFQDLTAASIMFRVVFWDILPCKIIVDRCFRGVYCLHHRTSETSVDNNFTQKYISEDNSEHPSRLAQKLIKKAFFTEILGLQLLLLLTSTRNST